MNIYFEKQTHADCSRIVVNHIFGGLFLPDGFWQNGCEQRTILDAFVARGYHYRKMSDPADIATHGCVGVLQVQHVEDYVHHAVAFKATPVDVYLLNGNYKGPVRH
eukprot:3011669-Amphidinium_carterae.2